MIQFLKRKIKYEVGLFSNLIGNRNCTTTSELYSHLYAGYTFKKKHAR